MSGEWSQSGGRPRIRRGGALGLGIVCLVVWGAVSLLNSPEPGPDAPSPGSAGNAEPAAPATAAESPGTRTEPASRSAPSEPASPGADDPSQTGHHSIEASGPLGEVEALLADALAAEEAADWSTVGALAERLRQLLRDLPTRDAYDLLRSLSPEELIAVAQKLNLHLLLFTPSKGIMRMEPRIPDARSFYYTWHADIPASLVDFFEEAARGGHGQSGVTAALYLFQGCRDCPESYFQPAISVLARPDAASELVQAALMQLASAPKRELAGEVLRNLIDSEDASVEDREMAMFVAVSQRTIGMEDLQRDFLRSGDPIRVDLGVRGVAALFPVGLAAAGADIDEATQRQLVIDLDAVYQQRDERALRSSILFTYTFLPDSSIAAAALRAAATASERDEVRQALQNAADQVEAGATRADVHAALQRVLANRE